LSTERACQINAKVTVERALIGDDFSAYRDLDAAYDALLTIVARHSKRLEGSYINKLGRFTAETVKQLNEMKCQNPGLCEAVLEGRI